ncbi:uncharacterized protein Z520_03916 [Fonsecaea multimorphosa CBS 102226]|uniref:Nitroreductase domain-containing protein n=1 Tax=Fonsecaea multimorphosa CBS 102226 TaxID=1442371 RepID=A0A0D2HEB7_9EURO|nr:uncharacterized protein Z520_03916 [Fonsecaea multimorphosa CBS 102226]KIY00231.1 hypothetical protein Z520_03916 [Fonsecaea multimorphosa CBS 102226]OAL27423.1 hypothetical protein AYO22_03698 [Fonsecaea multimorphosa]
MGNLDAFLDLVKGRRSIYTLSQESTIPDSKVEEIVKFAVTWAPSTYNVQSARAVVLFKENHAQLWDIVKKHMDQVPLDEGMRGYMNGRIAGWKGSYGTVLWFEDQTALDGLGEKNPMVKPMLTEWSDHSTGMHQFIVWTALEAEGLGANLQHFNFHPGITADIKSTFDIPEAWKLKAQLVFGKPTGGPQDKTFEPIEKRVMVKS